MSTDVFVAWGFALTAIVVAVIITRRQKVQEDTPKKPSPECEKRSEREREAIARADAAIKEMDAIEAEEQRQHEEALAELDAADAADANSKEAALTTRRNEEW